MFLNKEEELIKILDEFKIQSKLNNLFPKQSLLLFIPVQVQKLRQECGLQAAMEKAEANLFLNSKKNIISANQAFIIYRQLLKQLINMHSIKIAHGDVKPENIFYVNNKGWRYQILENHKNMKNQNQIIIQEAHYTFQSHKFKPKLIGDKKFNNIYYNDFYALVVSIIVIQKIHDIDLIDVQLEIKMLTDSYLIYSLNIKTYQQLVEFDQQLPEINEEFQYNAHDNYYKQLSSKEEQYHQIIKHKSWINLCYYYIEDQIFPDITNQLFQLINDNLNQIQNNIDYKTFIQNLIWPKHF